MAEPTTGSTNCPGMGVLAALLRKRQVHYCVLHGWRPSLRSWNSDVDIAVASDDLGVMSELLQSSDGVRAVQLLQHEASCFYFVMAVHGGNADHLVTLDVATDYRRDGRTFLTEEGLLGGRQLVDGVWLAAPEAEFSYLLVKKILKGAFPEHQKSRIRTLSAKLGPAGTVIACRMLGARWGHRAMEWLARADWATFEGYLPNLRRALRWEIIKHDPLNPIRYWLQDIKRRWRRWWEPTGLSVAVLGSDGAGKSTLISRLLEDLAPAFRQTTVFHVRPKLIERNSTRGPITDPHGMKPHGRALSLLKLAYYMFDHLVGYVVKVRPRLARSCLVVFDRYYHDLLVDPLRYRYGGPMKLVRMMQRCIPTPDLFLFLDVSEDDLARRKQEVSVAELRRQRDCYRRLAAGIPGGLLLDGSLPPDEVFGNARTAILTYLERRYRERHRVWCGKGGSTLRGHSAPAVDTSE
jgi:thymidylate kinase